MGIDNPVHILFIGIVALVVLGPKRLPELAKALGNGIREFRQSVTVGEHDRVPSAPPVAAVPAGAQPPIAAPPATPPAQPPIAAPPAAPPVQPPMEAPPAAPPVQPPPGAQGSETS